MQRSSFDSPTLYSIPLQSLLGASNCSGPGSRTADKGGFLRRGSGVARAQWGRARAEGAPSLPCNPHLPSGKFESQSWRGGKFQGCKWALSMVQPFRQLEGQGRFGGGSPP